MLSVSCTFCEKEVKRAVYCKCCDIVYCKVFCRNRDYREHLDYCRKAYTIEKAILSFPLLKLVMNRIADNGFYPDIMKIGLEGGRDMFLDIELEDFLDGKDITFDDISACTADLCSQRKTDAMVFHVYLRLKEEIIGEYILSIKK